MKINRPAFYQGYRSRFVNRLTQTQVNGYEAIFDYWEGSTLHDERWLAYILATAYHETGARIEPVREGFCSTDECSIRAVTRLYERGRIRRNYAKPHPNGKSYFGRGLVQLTHGYNYEKMGEEIGIGRQLYDNPSLALDLDTSVKIMIAGMVKGLFTTHRLDQYFNPRITNYVGARRIVNGLDKAAMIAGYAKKFYNCL